MLIRPLPGVKVVDGDQGAEDGGVDRPRRCSPAPRRSGRNGDLRVLVGLFTAQTLVAGALAVLLVVVAIELLDTGNAGVGWLDAAVGVGGVHRHGRRGQPRGPQAPDASRS